MSANDNATRDPDFNGGKDGTQFSESRKSYDTLFVSTPVVSSQSLMAVADSRNSDSAKGSSKD